ncbi:MAG: DUF4350 domain-containing protein [Bacteroidia bacterium]
MKGSNRNIWIFVALLSGALLLFFILMSNSKKHFDWHESFEFQSTQPYGYSFLREFLNTRYGKDSVELFYDSYDGLPDQANASLVITGSSYQPDSIESKILADWVADGHDVLIIQKTIPYSMSAAIWDTNICNLDKYFNAGYYYNEKVSATHFHRELQSKHKAVFEYRVVDSLYNYDFGCFDSSLFCPTSPLIPLASIDIAYINFATLKHGKGNYYFHISPIMFSNYELTNIERFNYIEGVFSYLQGNRIFVDQGHYYGTDQFHSDYVPSTPFSFILSHRALRFALYTLLAMTLIYILTGLRRKQRIIPVIEPPLNSSLQFLQATGRIYFLQRDHAGLLRLQIKFLLQFIRNRYHIHAKNLNEIKVGELSERSGVSKSDLEELFLDYQRLHLYVELSDKDIIGFYKHLNHFYKNCN